MTFAAPVPVCFGLWEVPRRQQEQPAGLGASAGGWARLVSSSLLQVSSSQQGKAALSQILSTGGSASPQDPSLPTYSDDAQIQSPLLPSGCFSFQKGMCYFDILLPDTQSGILVSVVNKAITF